MKQSWRGLGGPVWRVLFWKAPTRDHQNTILRKVETKNYRRKVVLTSSSTIVTRTRIISLLFRTVYPGFPRTR